MAKEKRGHEQKESGNEVDFQVLLGALGINDTRKPDEQDSDDRDNQNDNFKDIDDLDAESFPFYQTEKENSKEKDVELSESKPENMTTLEVASGKKKKNRKTKQKKKEKQPKTVLGKIARFLWKFTYAIFLICFFVGILSFIALSGAVYYLYQNVAPDVTWLESAHIPETTFIYDRTGETILYELYGEENRKIISHEDIPDVIRIATLAAEDDAFYKHPGFDIKSLARAAQVNLRDSSISQGGSTITMQLAKNVFLTPERTFERKIAEIIIAVKLERNFTKDEILDWYLNIVPYGSNAYGVQIAAETFFGKDAKDLTLDEAALLAAFPKATTYYSPHGKNTQALKNRQKQILLRIQELGLASQKEVLLALEQDTLSKVIRVRTDIKAPHFVMHVLEVLEKEYGRELLEIGGFHIYTTIDLALQEIAEKTVRDGVENIARYGASNAALTAIDPKTGEVLAMVGSRDYFDLDIDGEVNVATSLRQPGSAFKPIAYAKAFDIGYQPETVLYDVRTNFGPDGSGRDYVPQNYDGSYRGPVTMREALQMSLNIPAVKTLYLAGVQNTIDFSHDLGITSLQDRNRYGLSLVLGGGEITLLDGVAAFSVFANNGERHTAHVIQKILDNKGEVFELPAVTVKQVMKQTTAQKLNKVLSDNKARTPMFGPNSPLYVPEHEVAAKTGTTQNYRDAWTIGYTRSIAAGVWAGNNNNVAMRAGAAGVYVAAPIWNEFIRQAVELYPSQPFDEYEPEEIDIKMLSGKYDQKVLYYDQHSGKKLTEETAFKRGMKDVRVNYVSGRHSILYYINNAEDLPSEIPKYGEDMLERWERAIGGKVGVDTSVDSEHVDQTDQTNETNQEN